MPHPRRRRRDEAGAAIVSLTVGVLMFLVMVFTATQTMYAMYLSSTVDGVAYDAARIVAQSGSSTDASSRATATNHVTRLLNRPDIAVSFAGSTPETVRITVTLPAPTLVGPALGLPWLDDIQRTSEVRVEQIVEPA